MYSYFWPIGLVVLANVSYHICAKAVPKNMDPFATLTVTYLVGALVSAVLFLITSRHIDIAQEVGKLNWAPFLLGLSVVGLEAGFIFAYRAGWPISTAALIQCALLAIILIAVGYFVFHEPLTLNKVLGAIICMVGLMLLSK